MSRTSFRKRLGRRIIAFGLFVALGRRTNYSDVRVSERAVR